MARTYEDLLAAQTELTHFNPNHDPKTGQFAKSRLGSAINKRIETERSRTREQNDKRELLNDMNEHFRSQIKNEKLRKLVSISRTGSVNTDDLRSGIRKGKITENDLSEVQAAKEATEKYVLKKYGEKEYKKRASSTEVKDLPMSKKLKMVMIGTAAASLAIATMKYKKVNNDLKWITDGLAEVDPTKYLGVSLAKAGITAAGSSAALIGGTLVSDYIKEYKNGTSKK